MVSHGRVELLAHPLSQKYLQMKWNSYGKYFHVTNLFIYSVFLMFVTLYSHQLMNNIVPSDLINSLRLNETTTTNKTDQPATTDIPHMISAALLSTRHKQYYVEKDTISGMADNSSDETINGEKEQMVNISSIMVVSAISIVVYVLANTVRELVQMYQQKFDYILEPTNIVSWVLYVSAFMMVLPAFSGGHITDANFTAASVTVFLSWFNLLLFLQRFDQVYT